MSTIYYLRRREPMEVYQQTDVLTVSSRGASLCMSDPDGELVDAEGHSVAPLYRSERMPSPSSLDDLRDLLAGGRYDLYDEYGNRCDLGEVLDD